MISVLVLWDMNVGYPLHRLQHIRWTLCGYIVPVYYFFTVLPLVIAAALILALKRRWTTWERMWCLLPLICLPGVFHSADPLWSFRECLSWIVRGLIPGGIIFLVANQKNIDSRLLYSVYPIVIMASFVGLTELYFDRNLLWDKSLTPIPPISQPENPFYRPVPPPVNPSTILRPQGTQGNRIPYASTLVAFLPLGFWLLRYKKGLYWVKLASLAALLSIVLLAQVRAAWVGLLVSIVLMHIVNLPRDSHGSLKIIAGLIVGMGIFLALPKTHDLLMNRFNSFSLTERSIRERLEVLQTVKVLKDHFFLGVGFGQFPIACRPYYPRALVWNNTPDNQYLRWVIENGVPSFIILLSFFIGLISAGWKKIRSMRDPQKADFYKSLFVGWASIAVTFLFFDGFYWASCCMTFWCFLGAFATCLRSENSIPSR